VLYFPIFSITLSMPITNIRQNWYIPSSLHDHSLQRFLKCFLRNKVNAHQMDFHFHYRTHSINKINNSFISKNVCQKTTLHKFECVHLSETVPCCTAAACVAYYAHCCEQFETRRREKSYVLELLYVEYVVLCAVCRLFCIRHSCNYCMLLHHYFLNIISPRPPSHILRLKHGQKQCVRGSCSCVVLRLLLSWS
jgi:hypothetical protein